MAQIKQAFVLAAGLGTRLGVLTQKCPKPLVDIGGTSPLIRTLKLLHRHGVEKVVINLHYFPELIQQAVLAAQIPMDIIFSFEPERLETGGGIKKALPHFGNKPFFVVGGDLVWSEEQVSTFSRLDERFNGDDMDILLALVPFEKTSSFRKSPGDYFQDEQNRLRYRKEGEHPPFVYSGISVLTAAAFKGSPEGHFPLIQCFHAAEAQGRLHGVFYPGEWVDMGTPEGLAAAKDLIANAEKAASA